MASQQGYALTGSNFLPITAALYLIVNTIPRNQQVLNSLCVGGRMWYCIAMRYTAFGERVLELDRRGRDAARREMEEGWSTGNVRSLAEDHAKRMWELNGRPLNWDVTIERHAPIEFPGFNGGYRQ